MNFRSMPRMVKLYIVFLWIAGMAAYFSSFFYPLFRALDVSFILYFLIVCFTARITVKLPYTDMHFSLESPFVFVLLMLYGPLVALTADMVAKIIMTLPHIHRNAWYKVPFNVASGILATFSAYVAFEFLRSFGLTSSLAFVLPIIGMTVCSFLVATVTVAIAICIVQRMNIVTFWMKNFLPTALGFLASGAIATLLFVLDKFGYYSGFLVSIPLVGLLYFSQKIYLQKETEAQNHIRELENLHLSSIKSLSLALDAKDSYTHGHVQRVSNFAVGLAKCLGVSDANALKAIAFAGLVHDIGKIGVPDYILNKPGKYTDAEFRRMQVHPVISAEILKTIPLPFPIAKMVRHHHEKFNGTGYPDGLAGEEIPYESRILAVADIYDAVRSDRPYRPKMDRGRAIEILNHEKDRALDPDMVKEFVENVEDLEQVIQEEFIDIEDRSIQDIVKACYVAYELEVELPEEQRNRQARREAGLFSALSNFARKGHPLKPRFKRLAAALSKLVPHNAMVIYLSLGSECFLVPSFVSGKDGAALAKNVLERGVGISGWVQYNESAMLTESHRSEFPIYHGREIPYKSILSVPIGSDGDVIGALTLYSENRVAFKDADKILLNKMSPFLKDPLVNNKFDHQTERAAELTEQNTDIILLPNFKGNNGSSHRSPKSNS